MAQVDPRYGHVGVAGHAGAEAVDEGLRSYMLRVYNYMTIGVLLTGVVAYSMFTLMVTSDPSLAPRGARMIARGLYPTQLGMTLLSSPMVYVLCFAPLAYSLFFAWRVNSMSPAGAQLAFWVFAILLGLCLSPIFIRFTGGSIARIFFLTSAMFAALSLWGYTTKRDLSGFGQFLFMGLVGIILASILQIFIQSPALMFAISVLAVLIFAGLTAYDTQQIKDNYYTIAGDGQLMAKSAIIGACNLYLDFIGMFQNLLYLFGDRE